MGYACVQAFAQMGWRVLAHVRQNSDLLNPDQPGSAPRQVLWINTALENPEQLGALVAREGKIDIVINALAPKFSTRDWAKELAPLTQLSLNVAQQCHALLLNPLSVLPFGPQLPSVIYEGAVSHSTQAPRICELRAHSEAQLHTAAQQQGVRICTLRLGTLYGHAGWGWISTAVAKHLQKGRMDWLAPYEVPTPWAYAPDVAATLERVASMGHRLGPHTSLHFAGHLRTGNEWHQALQTACHDLRWLPPDRHVRKGRIQWWMWKPAGWFSPVIAALGQMEYIWRTPHRLDNTQLQNLIGPEPHTDWQTSVRNTVHLLDACDDLRGGVIRTHQGY